MQKFDNLIRQQLQQLQNDGTYKTEIAIDSAQDSEIKANGKTQINLCANNYLGLAQNPDVRQAASIGLDKWGYGMASVRFICGTQSLHKQLERAIADYVKMPDTIVYPSCFDANGGLFETLLTAEDAIISDELNHASIIDGVRLSKAKRYRYKNCDISSLEQQLRQADLDGARFKLITSDGVFSMDGYITPLDKICKLAKKYKALVHIDDCHATGVIGSTGAGTHQLHNCIGQVDIITGTLGKALGGASGGFTCASPAIVDWLRQKSRPYLFSNTLAPSIAAGALKAIELAQSSTQLRQQMHDNTQYFRQSLQNAGFDILKGNHPIVPVMLYQEKLATEFAQKLNQKNLYLAAFTYPVVPKNKARIRVQISAAHTKQQLDYAIEAFKQVELEMKN